MREGWQGSIVSVADSAGNELAVNGYDDYGVPNAGNAGRFQYTGQIWIPELGFYHYKARTYSPALGRFLQTDPVEYDDQADLYAYAHNSPLQFTDPNGMAAGPGESGIIKAEGVETAKMTAARSAAMSEARAAGASAAEARVAGDAAVLRAGGMTPEAASYVAKNGPGSEIPYAIGKTIDEAGSSVQNAFDSIEDFFGGDGKVARAAPNPTVVRSQDGIKQVRLDVGGHGDKPHAHVENTKPEGGKPTDATDQHRFYFKDKQ